MRDSALKLGVAEAVHYPVFPSRRRAHARQRFETRPVARGCWLYSAVGEELMRDSALKLSSPVTRCAKTESEKSSCATAL